jgi:hypothetical protein
MGEPTDDEAAEEARRRFEEDLEVRGEALSEGEELPPGATHEIVEEDGDGERTVRRRRFSAS